MKKLGPLRFLAGKWVGTTGDDTAPGDDRGVEKNYYREEMSFIPFGPVNNHEQELFGLKYTTTAFRHTEAESFHEETGYYLWDARAEQIMRCFLVPRGMAIIAGGKGSKDDPDFELVAERGSTTYGICANQFLDEEFRTEKFVMKLRFVDEDTFEYEGDTQILMKGRKDLFHHIDKNVMKRVTG